MPRVGMIMKLKRLAAMFLILISMGVSGCASKDQKNETKDDLIYQESISPNEKYVENQEDIVRYNIEIYQENDATISIHAKSNSAFFEPLSYEYYVSAPVDQDDITIEWTTLLGDTQETKDNQLCVAKIKIEGNNEEIKINFLDRGIELIEDALEHASYENWLIERMSTIGHSSNLCFDHSL